MYDVWHDFVHAVLYLSHEKCGGHRGVLVGKNMMNLGRRVSEQVTYVIYVWLIVAMHVNTIRQ